ncbi:MAG: hypothetical protein E7461_03095 [Ruminococcaceae bacterium]|nr:hypothetical protein [Oscillospiraceae bacterium]
MAENDKLELDLEDIIREFSNKPAKEKLSDSGDKMKDTIPLEDVVQASREQEVTAQQETKVFTPPPASDDTKRFVPISAQEETKSFAPAEAEEETRRYTPLYEEEELRRFAEEDTTRVSGRRSGPKVLRTPFQIMRRKIVEGPERQYYALREKGIAGIQTVILLSFLVAVLAIGTTVLYAMGYVPEDRLRLMIFSQLLLLLVSAFLGAFQLVEGLFDLGRLRFTPNTLLAFTFFVCLVDCALCLGALRVPCTAAFCIQVFMSLWSVAIQRKADTSRMDTMRGAKVLSGIGKKMNYDGDVTGFVRCDGDVDHLMDTYGEEETPHKVLGWYCFGALIAALVIGGVAVAMKGVALGVQVFSASLLVAMPATMFITVARPALLLERKFSKLGVVICGWKGAKGLACKARFPITGEDLFPADTVKLNGVKFYGEHVPAKVIGYAAAVAAREGGSLAPLLKELKESYNVETYEVESYKAYAGGIGGGVEGAVVLIGTLPMLKAFNVDVPADIRLPGGIGIALDGKFSCLLAVNYVKSRMVAHGLRVLCGSRRVKPMLVTEDLVLSGTFLQSKFGIRPKKLLRPAPEERERLRKITVGKEDRVMALCVRPSLPAYGYAIVGGRAYYHAVTYGMIIHILGGILGLGAMVALTLLGRTELLTPLNILLYQAIWMIPGYLITEWTRAL